MELFHYEIIHTPKTRSLADSLRQLVSADCLLCEASMEMTRTTTPTNAELYAALLIVSDDLAADEQLRVRIAQLAGRGLPLIPIVESLERYDFKAAPLPVICERNARGLDDPQSIIDAMLHHGGLRRHGSGGQVMISYARSDGTALCDALRQQLERAGFRCFVDLHEIAGGVSVQPAIKAEVERSDLVLLVDSRGAARSPWVADEMDMALAAHVPVLAISPSATAFVHSLHVPHVPWEPGDDLSGVAERAANAGRRLLASKASFRERVWRVLEQLCRLRGWSLEDARPHMLVHPSEHDLRIACSEKHPDVLEVEALREVVGTSGHGLFVGGTRPYPRLLATGLARAGAPTIRVAPLSRVATRVSDGVALDALTGKRVLLSAAMTDDRYQAELAAAVLPAFVVTFVQTMFELGVTVVYGGHPSVTSLIHKSVIDLAAGHTGRIELHQGRYWLNRGELPREALDHRVFDDVRWHGVGEDPVDDLNALRDAMIAGDLDGGVFVGGVIHNSIGARPGIIDEHERFRSAHPLRPAFVLGLGEGAAASLSKTFSQSAGRVDPRIAKELGETRDPDLATALIVAELLNALAEHPDERGR
ncbi:hypothetical protein DB30_06418 [Enhygromyxa salina]|uniref:TIR domain-containing protein n=1 Tax=Enhygromyxa salina TaxID=215803 RepID=A0A0C2D3M7_9BACT|nr:TIR domain-containing protein [Enhygromyxa salina]KIG14692.1 hypothetical protein DB30_06418 [Enhygromyxa salina]